MSDIDLINAFGVYQLSKNGSSGGLGQNQILANLQTQVLELKSEISILDGQEQTYDEMYKSAKQNPPSYGLFGSIGLRTTQDWIFAYFYFSYILCSVLLIITAMTNAILEKVRAGLLMFAITFAAGIVSTTVLINYA
jgi:hypothetical protein